MGSFKWNVDGEWVNIIFPLIRNPRPIYAKKTIEYTKEGDLIGVRFDYFDYEDILVGLGDNNLDDEYQRDLWDMLL